MKFLVVFFSLVPVVAFAKDEGLVNPAVHTELTTKAKAPAASKLILGYKSYNNSGRFGALKDDSKAPSKGVIYSGKHEGRIGYRHANQWGGYFQITQYRYQYNDSNLDRWSVSDPSVTLIHPDWYDDGTLKLSGAVRSYIPYSQRSKAQDIRRYYYSFGTNYTMSSGQNIFNQAILRFFSAREFRDSDTNFYFEDLTIYTRKINSWSRWGIGQWTQIESHAKTPTGYTVDLIPQVDFNVGPNILIGPRLSLPVYSQGFVYDGPKNSTWEEARAEIFVNATL